MVQEHVLGRNAFTLKVVHSGIVYLIEDGLLLYDVVW